MISLKQSNKNKKIFIYLILISLLIFTIFILIPFIYYQSVFLSYKITDKEVDKVEYIIYEQEPYRSIVREKYSISPTDEILDQTLSTLDEQSIVLYNHPKYTSEVINIYFSDGTMINCFLYEDSIGIDYGNVWLKIRNVDKLIESMQFVEIVESI